MKRKLLALVLVCIMLLGVGMHTVAESGWYLEEETDKFGEKTGFSNVVYAFEGQDSWGGSVSGTVSFNYDTWTIGVRDASGNPLSFGEPLVGKYKISLKTGSRVVEETESDAVSYGDKIVFSTGTNNLGMLALSLLAGQDVIVLLEGEYSPSYNFKVKASGFAAQWFARASAIYESGELEQAYREFTCLAAVQYTGAANMAQKCVEAGYVPIQVGGYITFGHYPQSASGTDSTPIEWLVLDIQDGKALLISRYGLDDKPYNTQYANITWEKCTLRTWLNGEFYNKAFTGAEQAQIETTLVTADKNPYHDNINPGNATEDKIFLLSITEANKYFSTDTARKCVPTAYAVAEGAYTSSDYTLDGKATCWWWLRSPGYPQGYAAYVRSVGGVLGNGDFVSYVDGAVRPALWVEIS